MRVALPGYEGVVSCSGGEYGARDFRVAVDRGDDWVAELTCLSLADARRVADAFHMVASTADGTAITVGGLADGSLTVEHIVGDVFAVSIERDGNLVSVEVWGPQVVSLAEVMTVLLAQVERTPVVSVQPF